MEKKTYNVNNIKQLIDLNDDTVNFDLLFKATCHDDTPFDLLVVDQQTLDKPEQLKYKEVKKSISGSIISDKNIFQNYYLILKSDKPCIVDVEITKKILPPSPDIQPSLPDIQQNLLADNKKSSFSWKKICLLTVVIIAGVILLWYFYNQKNKKDLAEPFVDPLYKPVTTFNSHINSLPLPLHNKSSISNKSITPNNKNISLLNRIRNTEF